jgi:hypothetical protein
LLIDDFFHGPLPAAGVTGLLLGRGLKHPIVVDLVYVGDEVAIDGFGSVGY